MQKLVVYSPRYLRLFLKNSNPLHRKIKLPPLRTTEFEKPKSNEGKRAEKPKRPSKIFPLKHFSYPKILAKKNDIPEVDEAKEVDERKTTVVGGTSETKKPEEHVVEEPKEEVPVEEETNDANVNHTNQQIPNENNESSPQQIEGQNQSQANLNNEQSPDNKPEGQNSKGGSVVEPSSSS